MIYDCIKNNPGITKTKVIECMKGRSAVATTHKIIQNFVKIGKIISQPDKSNSQMHHLFLNDRNSFNQIKLQLSKIESAIYEMDEFLRKVKLIEHLQEKEKIGLAKLRMYFIYPYRDSVAAMLQVLMERTSILIQSKDDTQMINIRITSLMLKLTTQFFNLKDIGALLENDINSLQKAKHSKYILDFSKKYLLILK